MIAIVIGFIFGLLLSYGELNRYDTIAGLSVLKDFTVAKTIMLVLAIGGLFLMFEMMSGIADFQVKTFHLVGVIVGGILFGIGMSILGYCPGTLPISFGQGSMDAFWGILGGFVGGIVYTLLFPWVSGWFGPDLGKPTLFSAMGYSFSAGYIIVMFLLSIALIVGAVWLHRIDRRRGIDSNNWIATAVGLALLNCGLFINDGFAIPLGASSCYPFLGDSIVCLTDNTYFDSVFTAGSWQTGMLAGAFLAGFIYSIITGSFRVRLIQERWSYYRGNNKVNRILWAFIGGILLIFGARMAGGCTSGHIISGGMQVAFGSYLFAIFTFIGFLTTGYFFYTKRRK